MIDLYRAAVSLAEDVLAAREETLRVQDIPHFSLLVRNFSRQLASFCRVLAMVVFEPEVRRTRTIITSTYFLILSFAILRWYFQGRESMDGTAL